MRVEVRTLAAVLLLSSALIAGCTPSQGASAPAPTGTITRDIVTMTGSGSAMSKPDRAEVRFGVSVKDADPRKAMTRASQLSAKVNEALKKAGIASEDLRTGSMDLSAEYRYDKDAPTINGYRCSIDVSARTTDIAKVGDVIVAATGAGATSVGGIGFDLADDNPARYEASANAVKDARARAEAVAKAAGRMLGDVISIGEPVETAALRNANDYMSAYSSPKAAMSSVPVEPGQLKAGTSVTVIFALK